MNIIKIIAWVFVVFYGIVCIMLYALQTKLLFHPGILSEDFKFRLGGTGKAITLKTADGESISALFFGNQSADVILYFHGNAGDLSSWQFVAEDFTRQGFNFMIIDYRGYGKSSGTISEKGLYLDAHAAYEYLVTSGFKPANIVIYGRSIGSGIAVDLASKHSCKGLILEAPFVSLGKLANEKIPWFFPSLYLKYRFDNIEKIDQVQCPVIFLHGSDDTLIPPSHSRMLFNKFSGRKKMIVVAGGGHNDLHTFSQYAEFLQDDLGRFFE